MTNDVCVMRVGWQPFLVVPLWNLIDGLAERGIHVTVLKSMSRMDLGMAEEGHPKADCRFFPIRMKRFTRIPGLRRFVQFLAYAEFLVRCVALGLRVRAKVVMPIDVDALPAAWLVARLTGAKLYYYSFELYTDRPGVPMPWFWDLLERLFIKRADLVIACEPNRARVLEERFGLADCPMTVLNVPHRMEEVQKTDAAQAYLRELGLPPSRIVYFHGWIHEERCADVFIKAMQSVEPGVVLFFLGPIEEDCKQRLDELARDCGVADRVVFHATVPTEELMAFAASADLGLQIQRNVGLNSYYCAPCKLFQYFSVGLPVVASNFPGMIEIIEGNDLGLCVAPEDPGAVASAINQILGDDATQTRMSENVLRVSREHYCYEVEGKKLLDAIETALRR